MEKVTFPLLSDAEIVECLNDLVPQPISVQSLTKPEPEFIYSLYENIVQKLMGISAEEMAKPVFEPYSDLDHSQLYDAAIYQITFIRNLFMVMRASGVDFRLSDLLAPSYQRTKRFLSAIINFSKYREEKFSKFEEIDQEGVRLVEEQMMAEDADQSASVELSAIHAEIVSEEPVMKELVGQLAAVRSSTAELHQQLAAAKQKSSLISKSLSDNGTRVQQLTSQRDALEKSKAAQLKRVIQDPEKELKRQAECKAKLAKENDELSAAEKRRTEVATRRDQIEETRVAVEKCVSLCQEISAELDRVKAERNIIKDHKAKINNSESALREVDLNIAKYNQQLDSTRQRTAAVLQNHETSRQAGQRQLEASRARKATSDKEHHVASTKIKELDLEIAKLETSEAATERQHQERASLMKGQLSSLVTQLRAYHAALHAAMKQSMEEQQQQLLQRAQSSENV